MKSTTTTLIRATISNSVRKLTLAAIASAMVCSCVATGSGNSKGANEAVDVSMLLDASPLVSLSIDQYIAPLNMIEMSPEMVEFLEEHIDSSANQDEKLAALIYAIIGEDRFLLAYDDSTSTAEEAFNNRRGNCLSFTNMFIAMARYLGLTAKYQEVAIPPDWSMTGQSYLFSQHVNVLVETRHSSVTTSRIVDFNAVRAGGVDNVRVISDKRARAHYFNNIGVEYMLADETARAFANFHASLKEDKSFSSAWANLGNLYRREGYVRYAEESFLQAIRTDEENLIAMSNLANLYVEEDKTQQAEIYLAKVHAHRMKNPYYRYQLANLAFVDGDYQSAIEDLLYATRIKKDEEKFCMLLSLSYLMSGDREEAELWMRKAQERAVELEDRQKYHHKLDLMMERADS